MALIVRKCPKGAGENKHGRYTMEQSRYRD